MFKTILCLLLIGLAFSSEIGKQKSLAVTIYNDNFAMVKDVREISFDDGQSYLYFTDVSSNIQAETVSFKALKETEKIRVFEQNFEKNLVNKEGILKRYIEKEIELYIVLGDTSRKVKGKLLGYNSGYIIQTANGINIFNNIAGIEFPSLPDGFFTTPTLNWKVFSDGKHTTDCQVAYRTTGFSWKSDYSLTLNSDETKADFGGWVTIDNNSGKKYENAKLKLIAGEVNTVSSSTNGYQPGLVYAMAEDVAAAPSFGQKSFGDYHLYTLSQPVTLTEASQKQVEFIPKVYNIPLRKYYQIRINAGGYSQENIKASNQIDLKNTKKQGLGIPLPKGVIRVFKEDEDDGSLEFVGEDSIDHTPKNENITITTGTAFDIVASLYSNNKRTFDKGGYQSDMNLTIVNHKDTKVEIEIIYNNYYGENLDLTWNTNSVSLDERTSTEYRFIREYDPEETFVFEWSEHYTP